MMKSVAIGRSGQSLNLPAAIPQLVLVVLCFASGALGAGHPDDIYWAEGFSRLGVDGDVYAFTTFNGNLVAAGRFQVAGSVMAANIAMWDGSSWWPLGSGLSQPGPGGDHGVVYALVVYDDKLVAAGKFSQAGLLNASNIAIWDGANWTPLGSGTDDTVRSLTVYGTKLIAGGRFQSAGGSPAATIASWDGSSWTALGAGLNSNVGALTIFQDGLIAGTGDCGLLNCSSGGVWSWDGSQWTQLGPSQFQFAVAALGVFQDQLVAGYQSDEGVSFQLGGGVAFWDGSNWSIPIDPVGAVEDVTIHSGQLVVSSWRVDPGSSDGYVHAWTGSGWSALYERSDSHPLALATFANELLVSNVDGFSIAKFNDPAWIPLGSGLNGPRVNAFQPYAGVLVAGGDWGTFVDGIAVAEDIGSWDGTSWTELAPGGVAELNQAGAGEVRAMALYGSNLAMSGSFASVGGTTASHVASWNGSAWSPIGNLDYNTYFLGGYGLASHNSHLYTVLFGGSTNTRHILEWNGASWTVLNSGQLFYGPPAALTAYENEVVVGGLGFGGQGCAAAWDGSSWTQLGTGAMPQGFRSMTGYQGNLVAAGSFTSIGGISASGVAMWDGLNWSPLGAGVKGTVRSLVVWNGFLVAGGVFDSAGGQPAANLAAWNGLEWSSFGSGINGPVNALAEYGGSLYAGGEFTAAGGKVSAYLAKWTGTAPSDCCVGIRGNIDGDPNDLTDGSDLQACVDYIIFNILPPPDCVLESDVDADGITDPSDLQALVDYIFFNMDTVLPCL